MAGNLALAYRRSPRRTTFIGITGSAGKSTAKELLYKVLSSTYRGTRTSGSANRLGQVVQTISRTHPLHRFSIIEMGASGPDSLDQLIRYSRPNIGIVLTVGLDHFKAFRNKDAVAREKAKLVQTLPPDGCAILNADDPLVADMAKHTRARVIKFGEHPEADIRYRNAVSQWPDRLSFDLIINSDEYPVITQLCGTHWMPSILGAVGAGIVMDIPIEKIVTAVEEFGPMRGRMSPLAINGTTFIRDDWKAPYWSINHTMEFMKTAKADRKIFICGTLSDYPGAASRKYRVVAGNAMKFADLVIFIGPNAPFVIKKGGQSTNPGLKYFTSITDARSYLSSELKSGDLVILKGSGRTDKLEKLIVKPTETQPDFHAAL